MPSDPLPADPGNAGIVSRNARNGLWLFLIYLLLYSGFVVLNTFAPNRMAQPFVAGINLAVVYGFGLIVAALILALVYLFLCSMGAQETEERR